VSSIAFLGAGAAERKFFPRIADLGDRFVSLILLLALAPLLLGLAVITWILSKRSPWIAHRRVGQHAAELWVPKIRTMWNTPSRRTGLSEVFAVERIDDEAGPTLKGPLDARVSSRFARFCRRHSLDELPQLALVLAGRMSLVGPRPVTAGELAEIYGADAREIIRVKPGVTGLWQVSGRNLLSAEERRMLDLQSVRDPSLHLYVRVILRTIPEVFRGGNTW
jgi:exopolysaccharide production protein ExoY